MEDMKKMDDQLDAVQELIGLSSQSILSRKGVEMGGVVFRCSDVACFVVGVLIVKVRVVPPNCSIFRSL